jgi:hypothetical protein
MLILRYSSLPVFRVGWAAEAGVFRYRFSLDMVIIMGVSGDDRSKYR